MDNSIIKRLGNLLSVKSLVTLTLTVVFAVMALRGTISQDFMTGESWAPPRAPQEATGRNMGHG